VTEIVIASVQGNLTGRVTLDNMTLDAFRDKITIIIDPLTIRLYKFGLSPNQLSMGSLISAVVAGLSFYLNILPLAVIATASNALFDALDGGLARIADSACRRGDLVDHVIDRYSDIFIIGGIFFGGYVSWQIGVIALVGVLMTSYLGTQAQALGIGRNYGGILGRADRLVIIFIVGTLNIIYPLNIIWFPLLGWMMIVFAVISNFTALQRFYYALRELNGKP
jgi:phosphatidylglycerophosphate synthase